jgi:hypothetical protein
MFREHRRSRPCGAYHGQALGSVGRTGRARHRFDSPADLCWGTVGHSTVWGRRQSRRVTRHRRLCCLCVSQQPALSVVTLARYAFPVEPRRVRPLTPVRQALTVRFRGIAPARHRFGATRRSRRNSKFTAGGFAVCETEEARRVKPCAGLPTFGTGYAVTKSGQANFYGASLCEPLSMVCMSPTDCAHVRRLDLLCPSSPKTSDATGSVIETRHARHANACNSGNPPIFGIERTSRMSAPQLGQHGAG